VSSFQGVHALIIEDDQTSVDVLESLLNYVGVTHTVITKHIADEIRTVSAPNVVFLDLDMPELNGYEVLELLHADDRFQGVPIVAYSTHTSHLNTAHNAGFDGFLGKPVSRHDFANNLARILNGESVWEIP
jgi:CheY-like chemotaxis protein